MSEGALAGLKVLDLTHYIAGPYCTYLLAGNGAEVIKVENPIGGDGARRLGPFPGDEPHPEQSGLFLWLNANKKGVTLNLRSATGVRLFKELVRQVDLVVENFAPRVMPALGLSYEELTRVNPRLVMTSISNFGQSGPYRDYKATEMVLYAISGLMCITGEPDQEPLVVGAPMVQFLGGQTGYVATLGALYRQQATGKGEHIDLSLMEHAASELEFQMMEYRYKGIVMQRIGHANDKGHPHGIFPCKDGWVAISVTDDRWDAYVDVLGVPELKDPRFRHAAERINARDEVDALMLPWILDRRREEIHKALQAIRVVTGWVRDAAEVAACPQLNARGYFVSSEHPYAGVVRHPGAPFKLSATPWQVGRAPLLGEHNGEILGGWLGLGKAELSHLRGQGLI